MLGWDICNVLHLWQPLCRFPFSQLLNICQFEHIFVNLPNRPSNGSVSWRKSKCWHNYFSDTRVALQYIHMVVVSLYELLHPCSAAWKWSTCSYDEALGNPGYFAGHSRTLISWTLKLVFVLFEVWLAAKFCWGKKISSSIKFVSKRHFPLATTWKNWLHPQCIFPKLSNGLCFTHFLTVSVIPTAFAAFTATLFPCTKLFFNMVCLDVSLCAQPFSLATTFCGLLCSCRAVTATAGQLSSKMSPSELHKTYHDDDNTIFLYTLSDLMFYVIV